LFPGCVLKALQSNWSTFEKVGDGVGGSVVAHLHDASPTSTPDQPSKRSDDDRGGQPRGDEEYGARIRLADRPERSPVGADLDIADRVRGDTPAAARTRSWAVRRGV
jgi:hypothetical protein